ncbi:MAG: HEAT repeat domain-containing protein [Planctomycetes bacterium]|nr:HEAT repeat domain-containing protein [Planctomycetota bacterium]
MLAALPFLAVPAMAAIAAVIVVIIWAGARWSKKVESEWRGFASRRGLRWVKGTWKQSTYMAGEEHGIRLKLDTYTVSTGKSSQTFTRVTATASRVPADLLVAQEGLGARIAKAFGGLDVDSGDTAFDKAFRVQGPEDVCLSRLVPEARAAFLTSAQKYTTKLEKGQLTLVRGGLLTEGSQLGEMLDAAVAILRPFATIPSDVVESLARNATSDPDAGVRYKSLDLALSRYGQHPAALRAKERALRDTDSRVATLAAIYGGEHARETLAAGVQSAAVEPDLRVRALRALVERFEPALCEAAIRAGLADRESPQMRALAAELAGKLRMKGVGGLLLKLGLEAEPATACVAAMSLGRCGEEHAEAHLLRMLERDDSEVRAAAARALADVGTAHAVEKLLPLTQGFLGSSVVKTAARSAVDRIRARRAEAGAGGLTVAEPSADGGSLSMPEADGVRRTAAETAREAPRVDSESVVVRTNISESNRERET